MDMVQFEDVNGVQYVVPRTSIQSMRTKQKDGKPLDTFIVKVNNGIEEFDVDIDKDTFDNLANYYTQEYTQYWEREAKRLSDALNDDPADLDPSIKDALNDWRTWQQPYYTSPNTAGMGSQLGSVTISGASSGDATTEHAIYSSNTSNTKISQDYINKMKRYMDDRYRQKAIKELEASAHE